MAHVANPLPSPEPSSAEPSSADDAPAANSESVNPETTKHEPAASSNSRPPSGMSEMEKIKAAHAARRARRSRSTTSAQNSTASNQSPTEPAPETQTDDDPAFSKISKQHQHDMAQLRQQLNNTKLEMASLRRNHLQNIKKLSEERDMFAMQLATEQNKSSQPGQRSAKLVDDLQVQLRAARTRNSDLEGENRILRDDVKQLNFRVQASKTLDAATDGYDSIVSDLVTAKVRCAELEEEKEELLRMNKQLSSTAHVLREANGELEKSRSHWVMQCAEVEKQRSEVETKLKQATDRKGASNSTSELSVSGSLQHIKL